MFGLYGTWGFWGGCLMFVLLLLLAYWLAYHLMNALTYDSLAYVYTSSVYR